jgi:hypothetical protein
MKIDEKALTEGYQVVAPSMSYGIYRAAVRAYEAAKAKDQPASGPKCKACGGDIIAVDGLNGYTRCTQCGLDPYGVPAKDQPDACRAAFEKWAEGFYHRSQVDPALKRNGEGYWFSSVNASWKAWQEAYQLYHEVGLESLAPWTDSQFAARQMESTMRESRVDLEHAFETERGTNIYRPRILDLCYTAFLMAKQPNPEDGGASDWMTDTMPKIKALIEQMKERVIGRRGRDD